MNPRAATNDLLPFQGSPFSRLGTSAEYMIQIYIMVIHSTRLEKTLPSFGMDFRTRLEKTSPSTQCQRRGWDSNPRALADKRFSRPPRYDHFDTSPNVLFYFTENSIICQAVFEVFLRQIEWLFRSFSACLFPLFLPYIFTAIFMATRIFYHLSVYLSTAFF